MSAKLNQSENDRACVHEGGCLCGHVRFRVTGAANNTANCHCRLCQKAAGAPFVTWSEFPRSALKWLGAEPTLRDSSPHGERGHCPKCGSAVTFRFKGSDDIDIATALFDEPNAFPPTFEIWTESSPSWIAHDPKLSQYAQGRTKDQDKG